MAQVRSGLYGLAAGWGLNLTITPSSSTNVSTDASTLPMHVSFVKEPVRYSEERGSEALDKDDEEEEDGGESGTAVKGMNGEVDGGHMIELQASGGPNRGMGLSREQARNGCRQRNGVKPGEQ
jgi:hypothetical protein